MKRMIVLMTAVLLTACASRGGAPLPQWQPVSTSQSMSASEGGVERVSFRPGVSSVTVERMAAAAGCTGGHGAGLMTASGPVEVYRMVCENEQVFMARCEFRQCKALPAGSRG